MSTRSPVPTIADRVSAQLIRRPVLSTTVIMAVIAVVVAAVQITGGRPALPLLLVFAGLLVLSSGRSG